MDLTQIEEWLKTTIAGIVLLGALGSIVAVWLLKFLGPPLQKFFAKPIRYLHKERMWRYWRSGTAYSFIQQDHTNRKLIFYLFRHLSRLLMAVTALAVSVIALNIVVTSRSDVLLTYGTFLPATAGFLAAYWIRSEYDYITINYIVEWQGTGLVKDLPNLKEVKKKNHA